MPAVRNEGSESRAGRKVPGRGEGCNHVSQLTTAVMSFLLDTNADLQHKCATSDKHMTRGAGSRK